MNSRLSKKGPRQITLDLVLSSTTLTRSSGEANEEYLKRVTHLHLQAKRIAKIEGIEVCPNLKVLYLYDNHIEEIENLDFAVNMQYLQLQNNKISNLPSLQMPNLAKLNLDDNNIRYLTGLDKCNKLEELRIANQTLPQNVFLRFDMKSFAAFGRALQTLDISNTGISDLNSFMRLRNLRRFFCSDNKVINLDDVKVILGFQYLVETNFKGNPCCLLPRYRDHLISASSDALELLDEIPVLRHQQIAIRGLMKHRQQIVGMGMIQRQMDIAEEKDAQNGDNEHLVDMAK